jgi:hypothetical protein
MSLFSWMSRPAWQSRDIAKRVAAVSHGREPALLAELPSIARNDLDASVRRAALERIDDLTLVADRMSNDTDPGVRDRARSRLVDLLCGPAPVAERQRVLGLVEDQGMLELIGRRAPEVELRRAALERCKRIGYIAERVLDDADADLRIELLSRIEQTATLERLAQQARTKDKRLFRAIRERLDAGKLAAGEGEALIARAEALCVAVEAHLRRPGAAAAAALSEAENDWTILRPRIDERFDRRFQGALQTLRAAIGAVARIGEEPAPVQEAVAADAESAPSTEPTSTEPTAAAVIVVDHADAELAALVQRADDMADSAGSPEIEALQRRWQSTFASNASRGEADGALAARFAQRIEALRAAAQAHAEQTEKARHLVEQSIAEVDAAIEAGQLAAARAARARARTAVESLSGDSAKSLARKLAAIDPRIDKLAQWQRWSDNKVRLRLCEEAEALIGSGMHPDGLANKVAELKASWKRIDDSEIDPGAPASESGLAKRFRFLCHKALEPARGYFEKRKEVRGKRSEEVGAFIARAQETLAADGTDTSALIALKRETGERLRLLDAVDPRQRGDIGKQLKQLIEACSAGIDARFAAIAEEKQKLIAQLRRQLAHAELDAALELAKSAQKRWQTLGKGSQKIDQALWSELRALIDPLFERRNDELKAVDAGRDAERAAAQVLVDEMRALPSAALDANHIEAEIARIGQHWRNEPNRPRDLERALDQAVADAQAAAAGRRGAELSARQQQVSDYAVRLDAIESRWLQGADVNADLDAINEQASALDAVVAAAFSARMQRLRTSAASTSASLLSEQLALGERLLLEYEFLAGVESPASDQSARLNLQVEKLAARMSSGHSPAPREQRAALDLRWWALGPLPLADRERLAERRNAATGAIDS